MAAEKFSKALIEQVFALNSEQKTAVEIAQILNIKKLQVTAVLAHRGIKMANASDAIHVGVDALPSSGHGVADYYEAPISTETEPSIALGNVAAPEEVDQSDEILGEEGLSRVYVGDDTEYGDAMYCVLSVRLRDLS
jgi:hypothetical protein